ncbi:hypothetical protein D3C75_1037780 [compost metagenome]
MAAAELVAVDRIFAFVGFEHQHIVADIAVILFSDRLHHLGIFVKIMLHVHQRRCSVNNNLQRQITA